MKNVGDLELYIDQSAVIGIFLSKWYFKSRCCLFEVVGTLEQKKPYLFIHEADPAKGGAPLEELKLELENEEHRNALFDGRRVTVWHRISDFQLVSLVQIAEELLHFSPQYSRSEALPMYVPGGLLQQRLTFSKPLVLFVSPNNPGAVEAAAEMTSRFTQLSVTNTLTISSTKYRLRSSVLTSASSSNTDPAGNDQHFLLYLNQRTYSGTEGEAFAAEVREARKAGMPIAMVHENDPGLGGCEFATFFETTPRDLIEDGLYKALAIAFVSGKNHRKVSRALLAKVLGAQERKSGFHDTFEAAEQSVSAAGAAAPTAVGAVGAVRVKVRGGIGGALRRQLSSSTKSASRVTFMKKRLPTVDATAVEGGSSSTQDQELSHVSWC